MALEPLRFTAIPKYIKVIIETLDENSTPINKEFKVYVKGPGCPTPVVIETDNVYADYEENYPSPAERENINDTRYLARARRANLLQYRDLLLAVSPEMTTEIADSLANDEGNELGLKILELSGWRSTIAESEEPAEGEEETGDLTLPNSTPSIQE